MVVYNGLQVAMATDVLFLIVGHAMYAVEWKKSAVDNQIVVHTCNMANVAQDLVFLMLHTSIPMVYVPAHNGVVVLSEPSHNREHKNRSIMVPYRRYLHVNHCDGHHSFLDTPNRILENDKVSLYAKVTTTHDVELAIHTKQNVEHFRDAYVAHASRHSPHAYADSSFAFVILEFGRSVTAEQVIHIPSTLTDSAEQEEIP